VGKATNGSRVAIFCAAFCVLFGATNPASGTPQGTALGVLSVAGEVYVNNLRATEGATIFVGETLRTGAGGAARVTITGRGTLTVASQTQISFAPEPRYFAELQRGSVAWRALAGAANFQLRLGNFTVVPYREGEAAAQAELAADGSAKISCAAGSIIVIQLQGSDSVFLGAGGVATVSAQGVLRRGEPAEAEAQGQVQGPPNAPTTAPNPSGKTSKSRRYVVWIGLAGGGVAAAAAALAAGHGAKLPESPFVP
jgi:hypothetical protein